MVETYHFATKMCLPSGLVLSEWYSGTNYSELRMILSVVWFSLNGIWYELFGVVHGIIYRYMILPLLCTPHPRRRRTPRTQIPRAFVRQLRVASVVASVTAAKRPSCIPRVRGAPLLPPAHRFGRLYAPAVQTSTAVDTLYS